MPARMTAGMVLALLLIAPAADAAPKRANLTVSSLEAETLLLPQSPVTAVVKVRNAGRAKAKGSKVALLLSSDARRSGDDLKLVVARVKALGPRRFARVTLRTALPAQARAGMRFLACADDARKVRESRERDNCRPSRGELRFLDGPMGAPPAPAPGPAASPAPTASPAPPPAAEPPAPNLTVSPKLDPENAAVQTVGVAGGVIEATGSDGSHYRLDIPADALLEDIEVRMTPLTAVGGAAMSGTVAGVDLRPHGLRLIAPGTLTVTPHTPIPLVDQMGFGYNGTGSDFHYAPLLADNTKIALPIMHFSGHGAGGTTPADRASQEKAQYNSPGEEEAFNRGGEILRRAKAEGRPIPLDELEPVFKAWYENSVKPNLLAAQSAESKVLPALREWLSWGRNMALLGFADVLQPSLEARLGREASASHNAAYKVLVNAYKRARDACLIDHEIEAGPRMLRYDKDLHMIFNTGLGLDRVFADLERCLRFELDFKVVMSSSSSENGFYEVEALDVGVEKVLIRLDPQFPSHASFLLREKSLVFNSWTMTNNQGEDGAECAHTLVDVAEKLPFQFRDLRLDLNYSDESPTPRADRVILNFHPGQGRGRFDNACQETPGTVDVVSHMWPNLWLLKHPEIQQTFINGLNLGGFSYVGGAVLARRTYSIDLPQTEALSAYTETSTIEIRHTPG